MSNLYVFIILTNFDFFLCSGDKSEDHTQQKSDMLLPKDKNISQKQGKPIQTILQIRSQRNKKLSNRNNRKFTRRSTLLEKVSVP